MFLAHYADSINQNIADLQNSLDSINLENKKLAAKCDSIAKERYLFDGPNSQRTIYVAAKNEPFPNFVGHINWIDSNIITPQRPQTPVREISKPRYQVTPVCLDSSHIKKIITKNEYELPVLVRIDLELIQRFNQRMEKYSKKLLDDINKLEKNRIELERKNETLAETVLQLASETDVWVIMFDSSRSELKRSQENVNKIIEKYNAFVMKYFQKYNEQFVLIDEFRKLVLQKVNMKSEKPNVSHKK